MFTPLGLWAVLGSQGGLVHSPWAVLGSQGGLVHSPWAVLGSQGGLVQQQSPGNFPGLELLLPLFLHVTGWGAKKQF